MGTIVGVETAGGVVLGGDRQRTEGGVVTGTSADKVFDFGDVGVAIVGEQGDLDEFARRFEADLEKRRAGGETLSLSKVENVAATLADECDVDALVATRDADGDARLRATDAEGGVLSDPTAARGTGAELALGRLETADSDADLAAAEQLVRETLAAVAERDSETGPDVDVWRLEN